MHGISWQHLAHLSMVEEVHFYIVYHLLTSSSTWIDSQSPHVTILTQSWGSIYYIWHLLVGLLLDSWFESIVLYLAHGILPWF
jgi:hypothetical protein